MSTRGIGCVLKVILPPHTNLLFNIAVLNNNSVQLSDMYQSCMCSDCTGQQAEMELMNTYCLAACCVRFHIKGQSTRPGR